MVIRKATYKDLDEIASIFEYARAFMKANGNPNQWKDNRPSMDTVRSDIDNGNFYIVERGQEIVACFAFIIGEDATYLKIEDGAWLNDLEYGTIHRIASNGKTHGIMDFVLNYCRGLIGNIRIDTHSDNRVMQNILAKQGFQYCGIIYTDDGTPRLAYQYYRA